MANHVLRNHTSSFCSSVDKDADAKHVYFLERLAAALTTEGIAELRQVTGRVAARVCVCLLVVCLSMHCISVAPGPCCAVVVLRAASIRLS